MKIYLEAKMVKKMLDEILRRLILSKYPNGYYLKDIKILEASENSVSVKTICEMPIGGGVQVLTNGYKISIDAIPIEKMSRFCKK